MFKGDCLLMSEKVETNLKKLRKKIDSVDRRIIRLLRRRFEAVEEVAKVKKNLGLGANDEAREREVIQNCKNAAKGLDKEFVEKLAKLILAQSKKIQSRK